MCPQLQLQSSFKSNCQLFVFVGLNLVLYSEDLEYMDEFAMSRGYRLHVHPFKTYHNIVQQGLSLETGKQTYIGLKMVNKSREFDTYI